VKIVCSFVIVLASASGASAQPPNGTSSQKPSGTSAQKPAPKKSAGNKIGAFTLHRQMDELTREDTSYIITSSSTRDHMLSLAAARKASIQHSSIWSVSHHPAVNVS
jgi:hypothetical protein